MNLDITKILEGSVAVPYSQEVLDCLESACVSYMKDDPDYQKMEELTGSFLTGNVSMDFKDTVNSALNGSGLNGMLPDNVLVRLSLYAICSCFNSENELDRAIRATIFMNYMILKKNHFDSLPNSTYIKEIYQWHLSQYLSENDSAETGRRTEWIEKIAEEGQTILQNGISRTEDIRHIQMLAKEASFYRVRLSVEDNSVRSIGSPYVRVFKGLNAMINSMEYPFYNFDLQGIISLLLRPDEEGKGKKRKLASYIDGLRKEKDCGNEPEMDSSVLLRLIYSKEADSLKNVLDMSFGVREFAIYLYYELLLERITQKLSE